MTARDRRSSRPAPAPAQPARKPSPRENIRVVLIEQSVGGAVARILRPQWVKTPDGCQLALVQAQGADARALDFAQLVQLAAGKLDLTTLPAAAASSRDATSELVHPSSRPPVSDAPPGQDIPDHAGKTVGHYEVVMGPIGPEHEERVRKRIARKAEQDGVRIGEVTFVQKGNRLIGSAPVLSS